MADSSKRTDGSMSTSQAGRMGGERVRELVEEGKRAEGKSGRGENFGEKTGRDTRTDEGNQQTSK